MAAPRSGKVRPSSTAIAGAAQQARALADAGRQAEAERLYRELLAYDGGNFDALMGLGALCSKRGAMQEAAVLLRKAVNQRSGSADAHLELGFALGSLGRVDEAIGRFRNALRLRPDCFRSLCNLGSLLAMQNALPEALAVFDRAVAIDPAIPFPRWHRGIVALALGQFDTGWQDIMARPPAPSAPVRSPVWDGSQDVAGKTVLLRAEQGIGDMIQFVRYAPAVAARGATVVLEAHAPLLPLLDGRLNIASVHALDGALPPHDYHCALMSLPGMFWDGVATVPPAPYLAASEPLVAAWRARLGTARRPRIGVVWGGAAGHINDRNRSMPLASMLTLLRSEAFEFVVLQKEIRAEDRALLATLPHIPILSPDLHDFAETAAAVSLCDLVISVDTSVAHLAGALGRPVWILLAHCPDWRWMLERSDSFWYPSARLFRQPRPQDWDSVVGAVRSALDEPLTRAVSD